MLECKNNQALVKCLTELQYLPLEAVIKLVKAYLPVWYSLDH